MILLATAAIGPSVRGAVLGVSFTDGTLVDVNPATGATSNPRGTGLVDPVGIAFSPGGTLYTLTAFGGGSAGNSVYTINPTTGASTRVGATGLTTVIEGDLAFSPTGTLYGLESSSGSGYQMFTINTSTGAATIVGTLANSSAEFSGMAFTPAGTLYVLENTSNSNTGSAGALLTVNPADGATLSSVNLSRTLGFTDGMYFDPASGNLIVADGGSSANNDLFSLNPLTGNLTVIGSLTAAAPNGLSGLAVTPTATSVPLPPAAPAAALTVLGLATWATLRSRRATPLGA